MKLRKANKGDLNKILLLHDKLFSYKYTYDNYLIELSLDISDFMILEKEQNIIGYFIVHTTFETMELIIIGVSSEYQSMGYGQFLMEYIDFLFKKYQCTNLLLEVESTNNNAIKLYENNGFKRIHNRKDYYAYQSDCLVYQKELTYE